MEKQQKGLVVRTAERFGVDATKLFHTLKATAFKGRGKHAVEPTAEQMMSLLIVAEQHGLNPFTKEICAFPGGGGEITPVVTVDGWVRIINEHPAFDGVEFQYSDQTIQLPGAKPCPEWIDVVLHRKDRTKPTVVREYLDEVYQEPRRGFDGPWQSHTKRMFRHKGLIQAARVAFGFAGIYDPDEAERIRDMGEAEVMASTNFPGQQASGMQTQVEPDEVVIYPELDDEGKQAMAPLLSRILERCRSAGTWEAAREYVEGRFNTPELGSHRQYALEQIDAAEKAAACADEAELDYEDLAEQALEQELAEESVPAALEQELAEESVPA